MKNHYLLLLLFSLFIKTLVAQDIPISGTIISADDKMPIPGVTVMLKGTTAGTTSGLNGKYSLVAPSNGVLVFSFVGMQTQEIPVDGHKVINVKMTDQDVPLGEIVVVGYSTASRKLISSSVELLNEDEIKNMPVRTIDGVLQGQTAGLTVNTQSGTPGGQNMIKLRGGELHQCQ